MQKFIKQHPKFPSNSVNHVILCQHNSDHMLQWQTRSWWRNHKSWESPTDTSSAPAPRKTGVSKLVIHLVHHSQICCLHTCLIPLDTQLHSWLPQCPAAIGTMDTCTDTGQGIFPPLAAGTAIPCLIFYASLAPSTCKGERYKNTKLKQSVGMCTSAQGMRLSLDIPAFSHHSQKHHFELNDM